MNDIIIHICIGGDFRNLLQRYGLLMRWHFTKFHFFIVSKRFISQNFTRKRKKSEVKV